MKKLRTNVAPKTVDEYLAAVPEPARSTLQKMRAAIWSVLPSEAIETISYGMPTFKFKGSLIWYAAFSDHCSVFPTAAVINEFRPELKNFEISKGTIRIPLGRPLPASLLKKMVKKRLAQVEKT